jgi:hypothetical protein
MNARDELYAFATAAFKETGVPPLVEEFLTKLLDNTRSEAIAERDAQIIAWLEKKAREEGTSNKDSRLRATAIYRMADKLSRGAVRPPLSTGPDAIEYGIRLAPDAPDAEILNYARATRAVVEGRLTRHRPAFPDARLLQRTVRHGQWTDAPTS